MGQAALPSKHYGRFYCEQTAAGNRIIFRHCELTGTEPLHYEVTPGIDTMPKELKKILQECPNRPYLGTRKKQPNGQYGPYEWKSYAEINALAINMAKAIDELNLATVTEYKGRPLKMVAIHSRNREEWMVTDIACWHSSLTTVPLYDTLGEESLAWIFEQTEVKSIFLSANCLPKLLSAKEKGYLKTLENIISFDHDLQEQFLKTIDRCGLRLMYFDDLLEIGKKNTKAVLKEATPDTFQAIIYTSGTTAKGKGVEITYKNYHAESSQLYAGNFFPEVYKTGSTILSYLPLAHVMDRAYHYWYLIARMKIGFFRGEVPKLMDDAVELKPEAFIGVPRIYLRVYDKAVAEINATKGVKKMLLEKALEYKLEMYQKYGVVENKFYDELILKKIRGIMGGNIRIMISGAAPLDYRIMEKLRVMFSSHLLSAYGQTETSACISMTYPDDRTQNSIGAPLKCNELSLLDVPEMNYKATDVVDGVNIPRGELLVRGPNVMQGYFKDPVKTAEAIDGDRWYHSGDIAEFLPNGTMRLIDRKKNFFKLSQGEYIAPEKIENVLVNSMYVNQVFVHGDSYQSYLVAVVVPQKDALIALALDKRITGNYSDLCKNQVLVDLIHKDLLKLQKSVDMSGLEMIKKIYLSPAPFSVENDTLTPTFKLKRNQALKMHADTIKALYAEGLNTSQGV